MSKTRSIRWDKLDNTANLFPSIAGESMTNVYRISVTLTDEIDSEKLQEALDIVLPYSGTILRKMAKRHQRCMRKIHFRADL